MATGNRYVKTWNTPDEMYEDWKAYRQECDEHITYKTEFSQKAGAFVTEKVPSPITCTINGFAVWAGMSQQNFYEVYNNDSTFGMVIARMKSECEQDCRRKFEDGSINSRLAGLWMSHYGYSTKTDSNVTGAVPVVISGGEDLKD